MKPILLACMLLLVSCGAELRAQAVTNAYLDRLEAEHQACLDSGIRMLDCATSYYATMDSLLNVVYAKVRSKLSPAQKASLKQEQLAWLRRRDALGRR